MAEQPSQPMCACAICGTRVWVLPVNDNTGLWDLRPLWQQDIVYLTFNPPAPPYLTKFGRLVSPSPSEIEPEAYQISLQRFVRTGASVRPFSDLSSTGDGNVYCIHGSCWRIFQSFARRVYHTDITPEMLEALVGVFESIPCEEGRLVWPHSEEGFFVTYWDELRKQPGLGLQGIWYLQEDPRSYEGDLSHKAIDHKIQIEVELKKYGMDKEKYALAAREDGFWVPTIPGLPVEIVVRVIEFLDGNGIVKFGSIDSNQRVKVPDYVWKQQFKPRGVMGWVNNTGFWEGKWESFYERFFGVKAWLSERSGSNRREIMMSRRRIWVICEGLMDVMWETANCEVAKSEGRTGWVDERPAEFYVYVPQTRDNSRVTWHEGGPIEATGAMVSYTGSGRMRFVSGLRFLPEGQRIGMVNPNDEVYLELSSMIPTKMMIRAVANQFGIKSISTGPWEEGSSADSEGIRTIGFYANPSGVEITSYFARLDVFRLGVLRLHSPQFFD